MTMDEKARLFIRNYLIERDEACGFHSNEDEWDESAREIFDGVAALSAAAQLGQVELQARVQPWMMACFGPEISADRVERGDRLLEEVFELLQSGGYDPARVLALRDYVWGRGTGEPFQEVGGVMITLAAYCLAHDLNMHTAGEVELARIWTKVDKIRAKQAAKPVGSALPAALLPITQAGECSEAGAWTREDLAKGLAMLDGIALLDIQSTVGPEADANNWREYLGRADDLMAHLSWRATELGESQEAGALVAADQRAAANEAPAAICLRCQGTGELVSDWERYMHPSPNDASDAGVAECPDCDGTGRATPPLPAQGTVERAEAVAWRGKYKADKRWSYFKAFDPGHDPDKYEQQPLFASPPVDSDALKALRTALVAMKLASALPGVADEYDFGPAIDEVTAALSTNHGSRRDD